MDNRMQLNFNDIADAVKIIDYSFQQGVFKGVQEIRSILLVRDKLQGFVDGAKEAIAKKNEAMDAPVEATDGNA
jgi:hypothetical protein